MLNSLIYIYGSSPFQAGTKREVIQWNHASSRGSRLFDVVRLWSYRCRQRRALGELAEQNDALLRDMGISRGQAIREAAKPFWRR
jgi:uncharacterized protein YjiS (DUF1127 family)